MVLVKTPIVTALSLAALLVSGCLESGIESYQSPVPTSAPRVAESAEFDDETGALSGTVTDSELRPIADVDLLLADAERRTRSAADGSFSLSHVEPGGYVLYASKMLFESAAVAVEIGVATETRGVHVVLEPLSSERPRVVVEEFRGFITCTIATAAFLSEECGQGLQTPVGTYGGNPNNKIDWKFNLTSLDSLRTTFVEMVWTPASAAAGKLTLYVAHNFTCIPSCSAELEYCGGTDNFGPPGISCEISDLAADSDASSSWDMTARAWGAQSAATEVPTIVIEQPFTMYRTDFFGDPKPEGYSAIADQ